MRRLLLILLFCTPCFAQDIEFPISDELMSQVSEYSINYPLVVLQDNRNDQIVWATDNLRGFDLASVAMGTPPDEEEINEANPQEITALQIAHNDLSMQFTVPELIGQQIDVLFNGGLDVLADDDAEPYSEELGGENLAVLVLAVGANHRGYFMWPDLPTLQDRTSSKTYKGGRNEPWMRFAFNRFTAARVGDLETQTEDLSTRIGELEGDTHGHSLKARWVTIAATGNKLLQISIDGGENYVTVTEGAPSVIGDAAYHHGPKVFPEAPCGSPVHYHAHYPSAPRCCEGGCQIVTH